MSSSFDNLLSQCQTTITRRTRLDIPSYLATQTLSPKFYWKCEETGEERACLGALITLNSPPILPEEIDPSLCFYGALFFEGNQSIKASKDSCWSDFSSSSFFLPIFEIRQSDLKTEIISHSLPGSKAFSLLEENPALLSSSKLQQGTNLPSKEIWTSSIGKILEAIKKKQVDKVVLARRTTFSIDPTQNPFGYLRKLLDKCPSTSTFALQVSSSLFLGSTPEKLYRRKDRVLFTESIAGTRKRGKNLLEDRSLAEDLLSSPKDRKEVNFVKEFLTQKLTALSDEISKDNQVSLKKTDTVQHLYYGFKAILKKEVTDADLLSILHPTPAVNGQPKKESLEFIDELEGFERGLYAGVVGWISSLDSLFAVAIRSALIKGSALHAFAGTGIVEGSDPNLEWLELDHKISHWKT